MATVMKTTRDVKGIGLAIPRPDGPEKVLGQVQYVADLPARGLLHAKLLRSPHTHARILRIDTSRARALPGVRAVLTAADVPELKRKAPTSGHVDGAWWPHSDDLSTELPDLLTVLAVRLGIIVALTERFQLVGDGRPGNGGPGQLGVQALQHRNLRRDALRNRDPLLNSGDLILGRRMLALEG